MDGLQLVCPSGESPRPDALALPRASSLPRGHERADGLSHASAHSCLLPHCADPGDRAPCQRRAADDPPRHLRGHVAFAHSNTNLGFGPLGRIFVSPNFHRIHHKLDGPQDVNLGFALTIWDQLFRRAVFPTPETIRTDTGLPGRPLSRRTGGGRDRTSLGLRRSARRAVPPDARPHEPPVNPESRLLCRRARSDRSSPDGVARHGPRRAQSRAGTSDGLMATTRCPRHLANALGHVLAMVVSTRTAPLPADLALVAARIALAWIFIYYGAGKLFGSFNGPGIHRDSALLLEHRSSPSGGILRGPRRRDRVRRRDRPGSRPRLAPCRARPVRGHGDGDDHGHLVDGHQLADVASRLPIEPGARCSRPRCRRLRRGTIQRRRAHRTADGGEGSTARPWAGRFS